MTTLNLASRWFTNTMDYDFQSLLRRLPRTTLPLPHNTEPPYSDKHRTDKNCNVQMTRDQCHAQCILKIPCDSYVSRRRVYQWNNESNDYHESATTSQFARVQPGYAEANVLSKLAFSYVLHTLLNVSDRQVYQKWIQGLPCTLQAYCPVCYADLNTKLLNQEI